MIENKEILDNIDFKKGKKKSDFTFFLKYLLVALFIFAFWIQFKALNVQFEIQKLLNNPDGFVGCFFAPYSERPIVIGIFILGLLSFLFILKNSKWNFPTRIIDKIILIGSIALIQFDQYIMFTVF